MYPRLSIALVSFIVVASCGGAARTTSTTSTVEPIDDQEPMPLPLVAAGGPIPTEVFASLEQIYSALVTRRARGTDDAAWFPRQHGAFFPAQRVCAEQPFEPNASEPRGAELAPDREAPGGAERDESLPWHRELGFAPERMFARYAIAMDDDTGAWSITARVDGDCNQSEVEVTISGGRGAEGTLVRAPGYDVRAPTPFTAEQIQRGCPPGRWSVYRVTTPEGTRRTRTEFLEHTADGAVFQSMPLGDDGEPAGPAERGEASWEELRRHASYPAVATAIEWLDVETPAGTFPASLYTVVDREGGMRTEAWFAREIPGPPVIHRVVRADGTLVSEMVLQAIEVTNAERFLSHVIGGIRIGMTEEEAAQACGARGGTYARERRASCTGGTGPPTNWRVREGRVCFVSGSVRTPSPASVARALDEAAARWGPATAERESVAIIDHEWRITAEVGADVRIYREGSNPFAATRMWLTSDCRQSD